MRINKLYIEKFKKFSYGYMFMVKKGVFLLFDKDTLEYKGIFNIIILTVHLDCLEAFSFK